MPLPLPDLDDRRWADLVEEGRSLIPLYAPGWTDHNVHDPGITLVELLAWMAEIDLYRVNRVPASHVRKFLALVGSSPLPPRGARTVVAFRLPAGAPPRALPADLELAGADLAGVRTVFRTLAPVTVADLHLQAIQIGGPGGFEDLTARWRRGEPVPLLGPEPSPGASLYLGFAGPLPLGQPVSLWLGLAGGRSGWDERERLIAEARRDAEACPPPGPVYPCRCGEDAEPEPPGDAAAVDAVAEAAPPHQSARTVWEVQVGPGVWRRLDGDAGEVVDETRSLTLDGRVVVATPAPTVAARAGLVKASLHYLRCRLLGGAYDAAPELSYLAVNGVVAEQAEAVTAAWTIARGASVSGPVPSPGEERALALTWNADGEIASIEFLLEGAPRLHVLAYAAPTPAKTGSLAVDWTLVGAGDGEPFQELALPRPSVLGAAIELSVSEEEGGVAWTARPDFDLSGRTGAHFVLDSQEGRLAFGDGEAGRRLPNGASVWARYQATRGAEGNLPIGRIDGIADNPHNRAFSGMAALLDELAGAPDALQVAHPVAAAGGAAAETLAEAAARAVDSVEHPLRAVTLADYETLALETPGVRLARAAARANLDPALPCLHATGVVTVIVLPFLPLHRPFPSAGTRRAVEGYLARRRVIGTRIVVAGPTYLEIAVHATVRPLTGTDPAALCSRIVAALDRFFHPLLGGPDGTGWPFGRDVYRSEVLQLLDEVPGVDHVLSLALVADPCGPACGNVCIGPLGLPASGRHEIQVG